jgi:hypothetical protein
VLPSRSLTVAVRILAPPSELQAILSCSFHSLFMSLDTVKHRGVVPLDKLSYLRD